jgi:hypothetical protein
MNFSFLDLREGLCALMQTKTIPATTSHYMDDCGTDLMARAFTILA